MNYDMSKFDEKMDENRYSGMESGPFVVDESRLAKSDGEFDGMGWYFYDEAYLTHGPFESKEVAEQAFAGYLNYLMGDENE